MADSNPLIALMAIDFPEDLEPKLVQNGARILLYDKNGKKRVALGVTTLIENTGKEDVRPVSSLVLSDEESRVVYKAPRE